MAEEASELRPQGIPAEPAHGRSPAPRTSKRDFCAQQVNISGPTTFLFFRRLPFKCRHLNHVPQGVSSVEKPELVVRTPITRPTPTLQKCGRKAETRVRELCLITG